MIDYRENNKWTVYIHISPSNKYYVGITSKKPKERWRNGKGYEKNKYFYRAIQKYGWDNFEHFILAENLTKDESCEMEKTLIKKLMSNDYHYGYNICSGGEGATGLLGKKNPNYGNSWSIEQRNKMSEYKKNHPVTISENGKKRKSDFMKNKWMDKEYRDSLSGINAPCYGRTKEKHPMFGKNGKDNPNSKQVICLNDKKVYQSATDAHIKTNTNLSKLCMCCRGERKSCGKDEYGNPLYWQYYKNYLKENNLTDEEAQKSLFFIE